MKTTRDEQLDILFVDDEKTALEIVIEAVDWQLAGMEAFSASSGKEALKIIEENPIRILITDIRMPDMDGLELIRHVNQLNRGIACIVMSSYNEFDLVRAAMKLGAWDYLFKPTMMPEDILHTVEETRKKLKTEKEDNLVQISAADRKNALRILIQSKELTDLQKKNLVQKIEIKNPQNIYVIRIMLSHYSIKLRYSFSGDYDVMGFSLENIATEVAAKYLDFEIIEINFHEFIIVTWNILDKQLIYNFIQEFSDDVRQYYQMDTFVGISSPGESFDALHHLSDWAALAEERAETLRKNYVEYTEGFSESISAAVLQALNYISRNLQDKDLSLKTVSDSVGVSSGYLSRQFKEETGTTFIDHVTNLKLEKARDLYCTTGMKIYEIADVLGYSDWHYLYTLYKKRFGHSLSKELRKKP